MATGAQENEDSLLPPVNLAEEIEKLRDDLREAVAVAEHQEVEPGTVVDELRRGYLWKNKLLRPAQVRVAG